MKGKSEGLGNFSTSKNATHFTERYPFPMLAEKLSLSTIYERTGKESKENEK